MLIFLLIAPVSWWKHLLFTFFPLIFQRASKHIWKSCLKTSKRGNTEQRLIFLLIFLINCDFKGFFVLREFQNDWYNLCPTNSPKPPTSVTFSFFFFLPPLHLHPLTPLPLSSDTSLALKSSFKSTINPLLQTPNSLLTFLIRHS